MAILGNLIHVDGWYIYNHHGLTTLVIYGTAIQRKTVYCKLVHSIFFALSFVRLDFTLHASNWAVQNNSILFSGMQQRDWNKASHPHHTFVCYVDKAGNSTF
jgi:hypothetical protein